MRAVVHSDAGVAVCDDHPDPVPAADEVLVRVLRAGICETDLQLIAGYMDFEGVLGHEFVGVALSGPLAGRRVVGEINCSCRQCEYCESGMGNHCPTRSVLGILNHDGAFAETIAVPQANLHHVPDEISTDQAVFTEPLAAAFQIPAQLTIGRDQRIVVLGDGRLGNLSAQVLKHAGAKVTVIGKHASKLAIVDRLGIATELLEDATRNRFADVVVDCTGSPSGVTTAIEFVKPRGTIVLKTTVAGQQSLSLAPLVIDEITVVGSRCGPFPRALEALRQRAVDVSPLISARYPLAAAETALERARTSDVLKVLLDVSDD